MQGWALVSLVLVLVVIAMEDFRHRAVRIFWFPMVLLLAIGYSLSFIAFNQILENTSLILVFLFIQGVLLMSYFMIKHKKWINPTNQYIGWGDVFFLLAIVPLFSPLLYLLFYLSSLLLTILFVFLCQVVYKSITYIPLAGMQALFLIGLLLWNQLVTEVLLADYYSFLIP